MQINYCITNYGLKGKVIKMSYKVMDISDWQQGIDFDDVVAAGVQGVIIKIAEGNYPAECFETFKSECYNRELPWGVYVYTKATTTYEAQQEADTCLNLLNGVVPRLGVWFDIESKASLYCDDPTGVCSAFICRINEAGIPCGVYAGYYTLRDILHTDALADYVQYWMPQYHSDTCNFSEVCSGHLAAWQYTESDSIGVFKVDMNEWYEEL